MKYGYSITGDMFSGDCKTASEAAGECISENELKLGDTFEICTAHDFVPHISACRIIEELTNDACSECGEATEDWELNYIKSTDGDYKELESEMNKVLTAWIEKHCYTPRFWTIGVTKEFKVTELMLNGDYAEVSFNNPAVTPSL